MSEENRNEEVNQEEATEVAETTEAAVEASATTESSESSEEETQEGSEEEKDSIFAKGDTPDFKWYVAHALTGQENKVARALKERIVNHNVTEFFADIMIPEETVTTSVNGRKRTIKKKFFPGYILLKMVMNDKTWHLVKNTDKITGFLGGSSDKPTPISDEEAAYMTGQGGEGFKRQRSNVSYNEGDSVKVMEGPFASFVGTVEQVSDKGKLKVNVSIFGRPTPVELDFSQVEKV